ncbi:Two-component system sensor histidine kinase, partial [hydrothermal vent metagenome]
MNGRKTHIIIFVIFIISIIGLAIIQYQYLRIGLNLAKVQFNQKIGITVNEIKEELKQPNELTFLVGKAITKEDSYFKLSMDSVQEASRYFLNDFLKDKLLQQGIKTEFTYALYARDSTDYLNSPKSYATENTLLKYPIALEGYLPRLVKKRLILELQFNNLNSYFLSQLNGLTIPSLLFIIAI